MNAIELERRENRYEIKRLQQIIDIIKMFLTTRLCCTIKQFSDSNFCHETVFHTHILNLLKNTLVVLKKFNADIRIKKVLFHHHHSFTGRP